MTDRWERQDVDLDQVWQGPDGRVFRVVAIADDPTVTLRDLGSDQDCHFVISSLLFSDFARLVPERLRR